MKITPLFLLAISIIPVCSRSAKAGKTKPKTIGNKKPGTGGRSKNTNTNKSGSSSKPVATNSLEGTIPPENYDPTESGLHGTQLQVNLTIWIESVMAVDLSTMELTLHAYIIQEWHDYRLAGIRNHSVIVRDRSLIYVTDLYCVNCKQAGLNDNANEFLLRIHPSGQIYYSQSATLSPSCLMNLRDFPFDYHSCYLTLASYGHDTSMIRLEWAREIILSETKLQQFSVSGEAKQFSYETTYTAGNFTMMKGEIQITRQQGFYILQVYVPCLILVILSWIIYYMTPDQVGDRLGIGVTLILTMIFLLGYANGSLPKVSYIKAIDWYMIVCLLCISASLIETVCVYWYHNSVKQKKAREEQESLESGNNDPGTFTDEDQESPMSNINTLLTNGKSHGQPVINLTMHQNSNKNGYQYDFDFSQPTEGRKFSMRNLKRRLTLGALKTRENGANSVGQVVKKVKKNASSYMIDKVFRILFPLVFATYNIFYFKEYIHHKLTVN